MSDDHSISLGGRGSLRRARLTVAAWAAAWLVAACFAVPLVWMAAVSVKPADQAAAAGSAGLLPTLTDDSGAALRAWQPGYWGELLRVATANYREVWNSPIAEFPLYLRNSLIVSFLSMVGMAISSSIAAFGFSRVKWPGRDALFVIVLLTMMVPGAVLIAPQYVLFKHLDWIGTFLPLWAPAWFGGAFSIFLLRQFYASVPRELDEAAMIDGCSRFGVFIRILVPLSLPALAVVVLMQFVASWNDFLGPLVFLHRQEQFTLPLGLQMYQSQQGATPWNLVMAASTLTVVPVLVVYLFTRRLFIEGASTEGLKE